MKDIMIRFKNGGEGEYFRGVPEGEIEHIFQLWADSLSTKPGIPQVVEFDCVDSHAVVLLCEISAIITIESD